LKEKQSDILKPNALCKFYCALTFYNLAQRNLQILKGLIDALTQITGKCRRQIFSLNFFEFGGSFSISLEGDCHEVEVTPNLELLVTFGMSLEGVYNELYT
jgi:hypothetical protein